MESDPEVDNLTAEREQAMAILRDVVGKKLTKTIKQEKNFKYVIQIKIDLKLANYDNSTGEIRKQIFRAWKYQL